MTEIASRDEQLYQEIRDFLIDEAELLDDGRFHEWLELVDEDITYKVPVRISRERAAGPGIVDEMGHLDENYDSLEMRVLRLETEFAWAEDPPSRTRHFVSNVRVRRKDPDAELEQEEEIEVKSNVLLYRTRGDDPHHDLLSGERQDVLRRANGGWKLMRRVVILDQSTISTHNLAVFF